MRERTLWFLLGAGAILCLGAVAKESREGAPGSYQMTCGSYQMQDGATKCIVLDTRTGKVAWSRLVEEEK